MVVGDRGERGGQMTKPIWQVDAFTDEPFRGNPAAVCLVDSPMAEARMQQIALEMNVSETTIMRMPKA